MGGWPYTVSPDGKQLAIVPQQNNDVVVTFTKQ